MKNIKNQQGGFVMLLGLLIAMAIIALVIVRTDLFTRDPSGRNMIEQGNDFVRKAEEAKTQMERQ